MTKTIKNLLKAKELIEKKLKLNNNLLETIKAIKQDENSLKEENEAYEIVLKLIKRKIKEEYGKWGTKEMTREDLKDYKHNQEWIKERLEYIEELKTSITNITAVLSDMPKRK